MNSKTTILITSILAFALLANVNVGSVFATGGLDDEEEEEAIKNLQNDINELKDTIGTIELNLTSGANDIEANCPSPAEEQPTKDNTTVTPTPPCGVPEEEKPVQIIPIVPPSAPQQNLTCPFAPPPAVIVKENTTEVIEEIIENVTTVCNIPPPPKEIMPPGIVLPNVTEPVEQPTCNVTAPAAAEQQNNVTEPTTQGAPFQDGQQVATIEFDASCGCFLVDKSPEEVQ